MSQANIIKEEILKTNHAEKVMNWEKVFVQNPLIIESAYEAMDIYAEEIASEFAEWIKKWYSISKGKYRHRGDFYKNDKKLKTTKELFTLFLKSKQQSQ